MANQLPKPVLTVAVFGAILICASVAGFFRIFSVFSPYDDEGAAMIMLRQYVQGYVLYDKIYAQYGPVYYNYKWLLVLVGLPNTHNAGRLETLAVWVIVACLSGFLTLRLTRSRIFGAVGSVICFYVLSSTALEPGHPQDICGLIVITSLLLATSQSRAGLPVIAVLIALLLLIKVNLGLFFGLAVAICVSGRLKVGRYGGICFGMLVVIALVFPFMLFWGHPELGWRRIAFVIDAGIVAAFLNQARDEDDLSLGPVIVMAAPFLATAAVVTGLQLTSGTSFMAMINGMALQHLNFGANFAQSAPSHYLAPFWAIVGLGTGLIVRSMGLNDRLHMPLRALQVLFGLAVVWASLLGETYKTNTFVLLSFATPFLWLGLLPDEDTEQDAFAKNLLVLAALMLTLQVFPIVGTQSSYGSFVMVIVGLVALHDGVKELAVHARSRWLHPAITALVALGVFISFANWTVQNYSRYYSNSPLPLPGSSLLRLPTEQADAFVSLTARLRSDCPNFVTMPGMHSFYFWTGKEPPTTHNATAWMTLLDERRQRDYIAEIQNDEKMCVVYEPEWTRNGSAKRPVEESPLANYLLQNFTSVEQFGSYRLMKRKTIDLNGL